MHKYAFRLFVRTFNEVIYLVGDFVFFVEQHLVLTINPIKSQINHSHMLPVIAQLSTTAINYTSDFIRKHKF